MRTLPENWPEAEYCIMTSSTETSIWKVPPGAVNSRQLLVLAVTPCWSCSSFLPVILCPGPAQLAEPWSKWYDPQKPVSSSWPMCSQQSCHKLWEQNLLQLWEWKPWETAPKTLRDGQIYEVARIPWKTVVLWTNGAPCWEIACRTDHSLAVCDDREKKGEELLKCFISIVESGKSYQSNWFYEGLRIFIKAKSVFWSLWVKQAKRGRQTRNMPKFLW